MLARTGYRDSLLYNNLGHVYSRRGDWSNAVSVYREWTESGIDHSNALSNLSLAYEQTGEFGKAAATLQRRISLWPHHGPASVQRLATLYLRAGDTVAAYRVLKHYESTVEKPGSLAAEYDNLAGAILVSLGKREAAEKRFRDALRKQPDLESAQRNLDAVSSSSR